MDRETALKKLREHKNFRNFSNSILDRLVDDFFERFHSSTSLEKRFDQYLTDLSTVYALNNSEPTLEANAPSIQIGSVGQSVAQYVFYKFHDLNSRKRKYIQELEELITDPQIYQGSTVSHVRSSYNELKNKPGIVLRGYILQIQYEGLLNQISCAFWRSAEHNTAVSAYNHFQRLDDIRKRLREECQIATFDHFLVEANEIARIRESPKFAEIEKSSNLLDEPNAGFIWAVNSKTRKGPSYNLVSESVLYTRFLVLDKSLSNDTREKLDQLIENNLFDIDEFMARVDLNVLEALATEEEALAEFMPNCRKRRRTLTM